MLAAGGSSRLGTPKQLLRIQGRRLLSRAIDSAEAVTPGRVVVVLGADALRMRSLVRRHHPGTCSVDNSRWAEGMAGSLRVGLAVLPASASAALLMVSDQPAVDRASLRRLVRAWRRRTGKAAVAAYEGVTGVPAILPRALWRQARRLGGDSGARGLLRGDRIAVTEVNMPEAAWDIDMREDLRHHPQGFYLPGSRWQRMA